MAWLKGVKVRESPFSLYYEGTCKTDLSGLLGEPAGSVPVENDLKYYNHAFYWGSENKDEVVRYYAKHFDFVPKLLSVIRKAAEKMVAETAKFPQTSGELNGFSDERLLELFKTFSALLAENEILIYLPLAFEYVIEEKTAAFFDAKGFSRDSAERQRFEQIFSSPGELTDSLAENESLLRIAVDVAEGRAKEAKEKADAHAREFAWITTKWLLGAPLTTQKVLERAESEAEKNPAEKLARLRKTLAENELQYEDALRELKASSEFAALTRVSRENIFLRTQRLNLITRAIWNARPLCAEIARRMGLAYEDVAFLLPPEIEEFLRNGCKVSREEIAERKKNYGMLMIKGKNKFFFGKEVERIREEDEAAVGGETTLLGKCAWKGSVRGCARVVLSEDELGKVREGDVLVTQMTTPDFAPAFSKIVALVTDMGGITCHAAIIAREFGIPCVVGTRIATKVFKDGDEIEVDAAAGTVKKIRVS